jgi:hypothetical protein
MQSTSKPIQILWIFAILGILGACTSAEVTRRSALSYFNAGNQSYARQDYSSAVWNYRQAIDLDSGVSSFHYNLGLTLYQLGDFEGALESFQTVAEQEPRQPDVHYNLALVYHKLYRTDLADRHYGMYQNLSQPPTQPQPKPAAATAPPPSAEPAPPEVSPAPGPQVRRLLPPPAEGGTPPGRSEVPSWE